MVKYQNNMDLYKNTQILIKKQYKTPILAKNQVVLHDWRYW